MIVSTQHTSAAGGYGRRRAGQSAADGIVFEVESRITEHRLQAGHRIGTKQELREEFGVAPATLSEAPLIRLAQTVLALRNNGATVNDVLGVLDALDEAVIHDAALYRRARDLRELDALMNKLTKVWHDPAEGSYCNWRLHRRIAEITPNAVLRAFYQNMVDYIEGEGLQTSTEVVPGFRADSEERLQIHRGIVEAIRSQDQDDVRSVVLRHRTS